MKTTLILSIAAGILLASSNADAQISTNEYSVRLGWDFPPPDVELTRVYASKTTNDWTHVKATTGPTNEMRVILPSGGTWYFVATHQGTNKLESLPSNILMYAFDMVTPGTPRNPVIIGASVKQIITKTNLIVLLP